MKQAIYNILHSLGLDIKFVKPENNSWLQKKNLRAVLDIGANTGQFASRIHEILPQVRIFSFEPIQACHQELVNNTRTLPVKTFHYALGDTEESVTINISRHSPSSSLLDMADLHKKVFVGTDFTTTEQIQVKRLDDIAPDLQISEPFMVKIDVQGFEDRVIRGGYQTIKKASVVIIETSFQELYRGQVLFDGIYQQLTGLGFNFIGNWSQAKNPADGSILYAESIFIK